jgi:very-short-patch-repair endonuclease
LLKPLGLHFRRQAPVGRYFPDFVCHRSKLIVERTVPLSFTTHSERLI